MKNCEEVITPISICCYLDADGKGATINQTKFKGLIGSLLYLTTNRLYVMFSVYVYKVSS